MLADILSIAFIVNGDDLLLPLGILLWGINAFGYIIPESTSQIIRQPEAIQTFFGWSFAGIPMIGFGICAVIMLFYRIDSKKE